MGRFVVGLGTVVVDHQMILADHPARDSKQEALAQRYQVGGPVPTALALLARFGHATGFLGSWGTDAWGRMIDEDFAREGIDTRSALRGDHIATGFAQVWIDRGTGARTIAYRRCDVPPGVAQLDRALLERCDALHLDGWPGETALEAARIVKRSGGRVSLDTGTPKPGMDRLLGLADVVNCPGHFARAYFGHDDPRSAARELLAMGPRLVTITAGEAGARLFTPDAEFHAPALPVTAVDTCGAGDVFAGALLHAVLTNRPPEAALRFAVAAASLKCQGLGNREALPSLNDVESAPSNV